MGGGAINHLFVHEEGTARCPAISRTPYGLGTGRARRGDFFHLITKRKNLSVVR
jgi:hypothetical protein